MDVTLMHNPKAGIEGSRKEDLIEQFKRAGHRVSYYSTKTKRFLRGLDKPGDVVVIAGGDGTVRKVALRLIGRNVPISILPLGTANNIARALGLDISVRKIIRGLATAKRIRMDVGMARGPWGDKPFLEAFGAGLFARMMARRELHEENGVRDPIDTNGGMRGGVQLLQQVLGSHRGQEFSMKLDRSQLAGKYLLIEAMNIPSIGPALEFAPKARYGDGFLDVVVVSEKERPHLHRHLSAKLSRKSQPQFTVHRTRRLQLSCSVSDAHFDDQTWPDNSDEAPGKTKSRVRRISVEVTVFPGALRVLVPR